VSTSRQQPESDPPQGPDLEAWNRFQPTERELLWEELKEAREARSRTAGAIGSSWGGRGVLAAIAVMFVWGNLYVAAGLLALAIVFEVVQQVRLASRIRHLWRALQDPMDGS
jgi:hypothetical protein